jgi:hypothetical protein
MAAVEKYMEESNAFKEYNNAKLKIIPIGNE